jgi:hypothetical protein
MHDRPDDELQLPTSASRAFASLAARRRRCLKFATMMFAPGVVGVVFLSVSGLRPAGLAIPVFVATTWLLIGAGAAAAFARVAHLQMGDDDDDSDDDGRGPGKGRGPDSEPPSGGGTEFDWECFERDFRAYAERSQTICA